MHPVVPVVVERSRSVSSTPPDSIVSTVTMYSTVWCGYCRRLKDQMDREGITFEVVDIEHDAAAAELVMSVNGGNQTVPTLVFPDGSALTNPSIKDVKAKLAA
jgi:mycoredoxin